jgi:hypothetical protein
LPTRAPWPRRVDRDVADLARHEGGTAT